MKWQATAPSNIALIKYMGKNNIALNLPNNASLSYTLNHLRSNVELELIDNQVSRWEPIQSNEIKLSDKEQKRFLNHLDLLKKYFSCDYNFIVRSSNNFPAGCGLASSAASFAALTQCAADAFKNLDSGNYNNLNITTETLASLSRLGSGSSCRSFYSPWALWRNDQTEAITLPYTDLIHHTVVVNKDKKNISSSDAHLSVISSALYLDRAARAEDRLHQLMQSLAQQDWHKSFIICWQEFWDMHALFETCAEPFSYLAPDSMAVLNYLRQYWRDYKDGPLITMDAGPNIHLLFRPDQDSMIKQIREELNFEFI